MTVTLRRCLWALLGCLFLITVISVSLRRYGESPTSIAPSVSPPAIQEIQAQPQITISPATAHEVDPETTLEFEVSVSKDKFASFRGKTNLPKGTALMLSVDDTGLGFSGSKHCTVSEDGNFEATRIGPVGGLKDGLYTASVVMPYLRVQPSEVKAFLGSKGEILNGPLVTEDEWGRIVRLDKEFGVGDGDPVLKQKQRTESRLKEWNAMRRIAASLRGRLQVAKNSGVFPDTAERLPVAKNSGVVPNRISSWMKFLRPFRKDLDQQKKLMMGIESLGVRAKFALVFSDIENMLFAIMSEKGDTEFNKWSSMYRKDYSSLEDFITEIEKQP